CCRCAIAASTSSTTWCGGWSEAESERFGFACPGTIGVAIASPEKQSNNARRTGMAKPVRRVVTGHDENGKAIVISDALAPFVHVNAVDPEWYSTDIWRTGETPARVVRAAAEPTLGPRRQLPTKRGTVLRINHFPPEG